MKKTLISILALLGASSALAGNGNVIHPSEGGAVYNRSYSVPADLSSPSDYYPFLQFEDKLSGYNISEAEIGVIADVISRNHNSITSLDRRDLVLQLRELGMSERRFGYILAIAMRNDELKSEIEQSVGDRLRSSSAE